MRSVDENTLPTHLAAAQLPLPQDRYPQVIEATNLLWSLADGLDAVPLGETPPATAFHAGWEAR